MVTQNTDAHTSHRILSRRLWSHICPQNFLLPIQDTQSAFIVYNTHLGQANISSSLVSLNLNGEFCDSDRPDMAAYEYVAPLVCQNLSACLCGSASCVTVFCSHLCEGTRGDNVSISVIRQQRKAVFAFTLCQPRDFPVTHNRLQNTVT